MGIVVTGATGRLGGRVAERLATAGVAQRLLVRDPSRAPALPGSTVTVASYGDEDDLRDALGPGDVVLFVSASESPDRLDQHRSFVQAAAAAGVGQLVYTSFYGAAHDATFTLARDHAATEDMIRDSGLAHTFLRDNLYADFVPLMAGADDVIRGPAGDGRAAVVAQDDIADAAVAVLLDPGSHVGATYDLTGPEALSFGRMAELLREVTGRPVRFENESIAEAYESRAVYDAPRWQLDAWVSTYTAVAAGELARVTDDVRRLTGHEPRSLRSVLEGQQHQT